MKCPNCGQEMEIGNIYTANKIYVKEIRWLPKKIMKEKLFLPVTKNGTHKCGGIVIKMRKNVTMTSYTDSFVCKKCRKLIIDY